MTRQQIFNKVYKHLMRQGEQSFCVSANHCVYRLDDSLKCAVGVLISDKHYGDYLEGNDVGERAVQLAVQNSLGAPVDKTTWQMLRILQQIHDGELWDYPSPKGASEGSYCITVDEWPSWLYAV